MRKADTIRGMGAWHATLSIAILLSACPLPAAEKQRDWQTGKVLDSHRSRYIAGTLNESNTTSTVQGNQAYGTQTYETQTAVYRVYEHFLIEGETHTFLARQRLRWRSSKPANLTVNGPVKFALENRKLFVIDDDGKEHEMEVLKKELRSTPGLKPVLR